MAQSHGRTTPFGVTGNATTAVSGRVTSKGAMVQAHRCIAVNPEVEDAAALAAFVVAEGTIAQTDSTANVEYTAAVSGRVPTEGAMAQTRDGTEIGAVVT